MRVLATISVRGERTLMPKKSNGYVPTEQAANRKTKAADAILVAIEKAARSDGVLSLREEARRIAGECQADPHDVLNQFAALATERGLQVAPD